MLTQIQESTIRVKELAHLPHDQLAEKLAAQFAGVEPYTPDSDLLSEAIYRLRHLSAFIPTPPTHHQPGAHP